MDAETEDPVYFDWIRILLIKKPIHLESNQTGTVGTYLNFFFIHIFSGFFQIYFYVKFFCLEK